MNFLEFLKSEELIVIHVYNQDLCEKVVNTLNKLITDNHISKNIDGIYKRLEPCYSVSWFDSYKDKTCLTNIGKFCSLEFAKEEDCKIFGIEDVFWKDSHDKLYFNNEVNYVYLKNICKCIPEGKGDKNFMSNNGKDKEYTRVKAIYTEATNRGILTIDEAAELLNRAKLVLDEVILKLY